MNLSPFRSPENTENKSVPFFGPKINLSPFSVLKINLSPFFVRARPSDPQTRDSTAQRAGRGGSAPDGGVRNGERHGPGWLPCRPVDATRSLPCDIAVCVRSRPCHSHQ